jgi:hypothetical protein
MPTNGRWGQPQPLSQLRGSRRPVFQNGTGHSLPRRCVSLRALGNPSGTGGDPLGVFHNTSVP